MLRKWGLTSLILGLLAILLTSSMFAFTPTVNAHARPASIGSLDTLPIDVTSYRVRSSDDGGLYQIAGHFSPSDATVNEKVGFAQEICSANKLPNCNLIYPGQLLTIPKRTYTVLSGNYLSEIAQKYSTGIGRTTWQDICASNSLEDCNLIFPGQVLIIPYEHHRVTPTVHLVSITSTCHHCPLLSTGNDDPTLYRYRGYHHVNNQTFDIVHKYNGTHTAIVYRKTTGTWTVSWIYWIGNCQPSSNLTVTVMTNTGHVVYQKSVYGCVNYIHGSYTAPAE